MGLEKEIRQKKFRNEWQKGIVNIIFTYSWVKERIKKRLKPYDITMQQFNVLRILNGQHPNPISTSVIRERMLDKMSDASRIVERLNRKGLLLRTTSEKDRRLVDVVITEKGRRLIQEIDAKANELEDFFKNISEEEAQLLNNLLDKARG